MKERVQSQKKEFLAQKTNIYAVNPILVCCYIIQRVHLGYNYGSCSQTIK